MWGAIVAIVAIATVAELVKYSIKMKHQQPSSDKKGFNSNKVDELERRIESLESIIIDLERENRFRNLK